MLENKNGVKFTRLKFTSSFCATQHVTLASILPSVPSPRMTGGKLMAGARRSCAVVGVLLFYVPAAVGFGAGGGVLAPAFARYGSLAPPLGLRGSAPAAGLCMQQGGQPPRKIRKARKRSSRKRDPFELPEPVIKPKGGPMGKAKRRMLERIDEFEEKQEAQWSTLASRLQSERVEGVWAADDPALAEKRKRWNADLTAPSDGPDPDALGSAVDDQDAVDVMDTNDKNWKQVRDVSSGDIYFWNIKTDETTWEIPDGVALKEKLSIFRGVTKTILDPGGAPGVKWLCTQTTSGHAHHGVFFQVQAKDADVYITGVRTASHYRSNIYEATYRVLSRPGPCYGHELSKAGWKQVGRKRVKAEVKRWGPKKWDA